MSRWTETVILLAPASAWQDDEGEWHEDPRPQREVFCNERRTTIATLAHMRSSDIRLNNAVEPMDLGLRTELEIEVHTIDYEEEDRCVFRDKEYEILYAYGGGNTKMLGLSRKIGNE